MLWHIMHLQPCMQSKDKRGGNNYEAGYYAFACHRRKSRKDSNCSSLCQKYTGHHTRRATNHLQSTVQAAAIRRTQHSDVTRIIDFLILLVLEHRGEN
ncbi:unnamed protein product [Pieris brassicae]|uniref:Uncharacterized protein n=1 Tax=Pieris brassicae TaxID=7116 RepID=A0A9P0XB17_PIEBR|nr:unnamed protein product [Pieris brassicae]